MTVSAAPKYNIKLGGESVYKTTFDFNSGNKLAEAYGDGYGIGNVTGRVIKLGITVQLYNDYATKGFKGIELPNGSPITFDLVISSAYTISTPAESSDYSTGQKVDVTNDYTPLLWSCDINSEISSGGTNSDGRVLYDTYGCAQEHAPKANGGGVNACYNSGSWTACQNKSKISITVSNYEIDITQMPIYNYTYTDGNLPVYGEELGIGCFSAGELWLVQPYNKVNSENIDNPYDFDIVKEYGEGIFTTGVKAVNMKAKTISGTSFQDPDGTNTAQTNQEDDSLDQTVALLLPGTMQNRVAYTSEPTFFGKGVGTDDNRNGQDYAAPGTELYFYGGLSYTANDTDDNILYWATNLTKFYGSAFELTGYCQQVHFNTYNDSLTVLYATKKDGTDWADDYELQHTYEDDMVFYKSLSDIPEGDLCVGILYCYTGTGSANDRDTYYTAVVGAKVREDSELYGKTFMLASTSRAWTKSMFYNAGMTQNDIPNWTNSATKLSDFPEEAYVSANIEGSYWYVKETYAEDGSGPLGTHNSEWQHLGDTLLVVGYKASVTKSLLQKTADSVTKETFYLDANQRIVDFKLQPKVSFESSSENLNIKTTVTVIDTLPKYLTYHAGSSYFGGSYVQTSANGGTQGTIAGGTLREPDSVTNNSDGTQTLKWIITDVVVGENMPAIYYSADIGNRNNTEEDVPIGTTHLLNTVRTTSPGDLRQPSLENGNLAEVGLSATRGSAVSFGKYSKQTLVEQNGVIEYVVYFDNNDASGADDVLLLDAMPFNSPNGSSFSGTYSLNSCTLDIDKCNKSNLTVYYTTNEEYAGATITSLGGTEKTKTTISDWTKAAIGDDGSVNMGAQTPIAWAVIGSLDANKSVNFNLQIQLEPVQSSESDSAENNRYVNTLSCGETVITTENLAVNRTLEGLTWSDGNTDGMQNDSEASLSGVKVSLLKLTDGGDSAGESGYELYYYSDGNPAVTYTDENGGYKFTNLPAGTYTVKFEDGTTPISQYIASPIGKGDDTKDSDGVATYSSDKSQLKQTMILGIEMPAAKDMSVVLLESKYHDSGFYERGYELPGSGGSGTALYTAVGSVMIFAASILFYINRIQKKA